MTAKLNWSAGRSHPDYVHLMVTSLTGKTAAHLSETHDVEPYPRSFRRRNAALHLAEHPFVGDEQEEAQ